MKINELDEAQLRAEMREMYRHIGLSGSLRCLFEICESAEILSEVLIEELDREEKERKLGA